MKNLKVSMKLIVSFLIVIALTAAVGAAGIIGMFNINKSMEKMYEQELLPIQALGGLRDIFGSQRSDFRAIFLNAFHSSGNVSEIPGLINKITAADEKAADYFNLFEKNADISKEADYLIARDTWYGQYAQMKKDVFALINAGEYDNAYTTFLSYGPSCIPPITNSLESSTYAKEQEASNLNSSADNTYWLILFVLIGVIALAIGVALSLAFYVSGLISKPLKPLETFMTKAGTTGDIELSSNDVKIIDELSKINDEIGHTVLACSKFIDHIHEINKDMAQIANGNLTTHIHLASDRDSLGLSVKMMQQKLAGTISEIHSATDQVYSASQQIADGAQGLAQASTEQAASVEQLSSSIQEMSAQVKENASMATEAAGLSADIKAKAEKGNAQMDGLMQAVHDITEASGQIEKVIKVIDDIAFQTNILALNAAVEAARAGSAGKGFAVVAEEVRNLASKSAEAAKNTSGLIENSINKATLGLELAKETTASLKDIVDGINKNADIIAHIAGSTDSQAIAISHLNIGVEQVANVIQQNSATAEQSAAASEEMNGQTTMLKDLVSQFKT